MPAVEKGGWWVPEVLCLFCLHISGSEWPHPHPTTISVTPPASLLKISFLFIQQKPQQTGPEAVCLKGHLMWIYRVSCIVITASV